MKTNLLFLILAFFFGNVILKSQQSILVMNSTAKTVAQLNAADGSVINSGFINLTSLSAGTIKGIVQVQDKIWISDQTNNRIYTFALDGTYVSTIPSTVGLSNIRGLNVVNNEVWVTNAGSANGAIANSVRRLDFAGNSLGAYNTIADPFDAIDNGAGKAYITSFGSSGIQMMNYDGTVAGNLVDAGILSGIEQINKTSAGNYVLAVFSSNAASGNTSGLYVISPTGNILNKWNNVTGLRGAIQTSNGNYLCSNSNGVQKVDAATGASTQIIAGNYQYFTLINGNLAVDNIAAKYVSVFPNPTTDYINVETESKINTVQLFSASGQLVKQFKNINESKTKLNLQDLPVNVYILKVDTQQGVKTLKVIKK